MTNVATLLAVVLKMMEAAGKLASLLAKAHAEGRTEITDAELSGLAGEDDAAAEELRKAIEAAKAQGR